MGCYRKTRVALRLPPLLPGEGANGQDEFQYLGWQYRHTCENTAKQLQFATKSPKLATYNDLQPIELNKICQHNQ